MGKRVFLESVKYNRNSQVNIWYIVASWACEVTEILKQGSIEESSFV